MHRARRRRRRRRRRPDERKTARARGARARVRPGAGQRAGSDHEVRKDGFENGGQILVFSVFSVFLVFWFLVSDTTPVVLSRVYAFPRGWPRG